MELEPKHARAMRTEIGERLAILLPTEQATLPNYLGRLLDQLTEQDAVSSRQRAPD
jgi:ABC-type Zn2+ transport system substrate-binding protein/surface adhesin